MVKRLIILAILPKIFNLIFSGCDAFFLFFWSFFCFHFVRALFYVDGVPGGKKMAAFIPFICFGFGLSLIFNVIHFSIYSSLGVLKDD